MEKEQLQLTMQYLNLYPGLRLLTNFEIKENQVITPVFLLYALVFLRRFDMTLISMQVHENRFLIESHSKGHFSLNEPLVVYDKDMYFPMNEPPELAIEEILSLKNRFNQTRPMDFRRLSLEFKELPLKQRTFRRFIKMMTTDEVT